MGDSSIVDGEQWYIIPCPAGVQLTSIAKERGTHGSIYCLWECDRRSPCFLGQSVPALVKCINEKVVLTPEKRLHASSLYRCLRRESKKSLHKSWKVERYSRCDISSLNEFLSGFPSIIVTSKSPELWHCVATGVDDSTEDPEDGEAPPVAAQPAASSGGNNAPLLTADCDTSSSSDRDSSDKDE